MLMKPFYRFLLNTLMIPGYFACISATILVLHAFAHVLLVRPRHKDVVAQSPFATFEPVDVSVANGAALQEKTFIELHGGLVLYLFKIARLFSCLAFLVLSLTTLQNGRDGECLSGVSWRGSNTAYSLLSSDRGTSNSDWIYFSICATSTFTVVLSAITLASHAAFSRLVSAHLTIVLSTLFAVYGYRDIWPLLTFTEQPIDSCEGLLLWAKLATLTVGAVYPLFSPRLYIPLDARKPSGTPHPEQTASWASLLSYSWVDPTVRLAYRLAHLPHNLLPPLSDQDHAENLKRRSFPHLDQFTGAKKRHIFYGLMAVFRVEIIIQSVNLVIQVLHLTSREITEVWKHLQGPRKFDCTVRSEIPPSLSRDWWRGCACASLGVDIVYPPRHPHFIIRFSVCRTMVRVEAILSQLIFEHALRIRVKTETSDAKLPAPQGSSESGGSGQASKDSPSNAKSPAKNLIGKLNNLVTSDLATATEGRDFLILVFAPLQLIAVTWFLYTLLDWSALVGLGMMVITFPLPSMVMKRIQHVKEEQSKKV
ncbi:hypothetical protein J3R82DRAFT_7488 [Butyriboletus roseoflavus]|nr:hypothetical protein J3R82DRAFT_7488 [Butyriboletus roseoflavus]